MTKLELIKFQKKQMAIANTITFPTSYENALWSNLSKYIAVYGISQWGATKVDNRILKLAKEWDVDPMKVAEDSEHQCLWFNSVYE